MAGAALVALGVWAIVGAVGRGTPTVAATTAAPSLHLPGELLVLDTSTGRLAAAHPDGSGFRLLPGPAYPANDAAASPNGLQAVVGGVQVVDVGSERARPLLDPTGKSSAVLQPWADGGTRVVLIATPAGPVEGAIESVDLDGGSRHSLGADAGGAAGDPTRDGAVVAVQGSTEVNLGPYTERDTSRIELRWWQGHHDVLATTTALVKAAGLPTGKPYAVWPVVAPDGQHIALTVDGLVPNSSTASARHALVIVDRAGTVVTTRTSYAFVLPVWSPDSKQVAYPDGSGITRLIIFGSKVAASSVTVPGVGSSCLFSPTGDDLLCDDRQTGDRTIIGLSDGHVDQVHHDPQHVALAWVSSVPGGAS